MLIILLYLNGYEQNCFTTHIEKTGLQISTHKYHKEAPIGYHPRERSTWWEMQWNLLDWICYLCYVLHVGMWWKSWTTILVGVHDGVSFIRSSYSQGPKAGCEKNAVAFLSSMTGFSLDWTGVLECFTLHPEYGVLRTPELWSNK